MDGQYQRFFEPFWFCLLFYGVFCSRSSFVEQSTPFYPRKTHVFVCSWRSFCVQRIQCFYFHTVMECTLGWSQSGSSSVSSSSLFLGVLHIHKASKPIYVSSGGLLSQLRLPVRRVWFTDGSVRYTGEDSWSSKTNKWTLFCNRRHLASHKTDGSYLCITRETIFKQRRWSRISAFKHLFCSYPVSLTPTKTFIHVTRVAHLWVRLTKTPTNPYGEEWEGNLYMYRA